MINLAVKKLFLVIYLGGQIGGSVGPLPYGVEECQHRAAEMISHGDPNIMINGLTLKDVELKCEFLDDHPQWGERWR